MWICKDGRQNSEGESMGRRREALEDPCQELVAALRNQGENLRASFLGEAIPDGPLGNDEHLALLAHRLDEVAADDRIGQELRAKARTLAVSARDLPSVIGRRGRVFVVWSENRSERDSSGPEGLAGEYSCSWQPFCETDDDDPTDDALYEDGPEFEHLSDALTWARRRTD